ncbi:hypothetical protein NS226_17915 [Aureimonas ureilytica]|uniref:DUF302 domain-containing protein n=1 Tax=Aureimonas ureilytica TaxID=401562 RepID=A0A175R6A0_9HYPH|nr:DUF302 domain-containing protein [Aureimonas ureilytica]KTQ86457.1 hypothetical protein NS226_17915 [Aureimonas ureilytica]
MQRILRTTLVAFAILGSMAAARAADGLNVRDATGSVEEAVSRLTAAIKDAGAKVVAVVDHAENARSVGKELPDTTLVIFGNPKLGTSLIEENSLVALDLPQKMLVWRDGETTKVGYLEPEVMATRYGIAPEAGPVSTMTAAMDRLANAAASPR